MLLIHLGVSISTARSDGPGYNRDIKTIVE